MDYAFQRAEGEAGGGIAGRSIPGGSSQLRIRRLNFPPPSPVSLTKKNPLPVILFPPAFEHTSNVINISHFTVFFYLCKLKNILIVSLQLCISSLLCYDQCYGSEIIYSGFGSYPSFHIVRGPDPSLKTRPFNNLQKIYVNTVTNFQSILKILQGNKYGM